MDHKQGITALILLGLAVISGCSTTEPASTPVARQQPVVDPQLAKGRQQLVDALDAAWIRVVASGKDREIYKSMPPSKPGAASSYMVTLADCLPSPEVAPFPDRPVGLLKEILERGVIRQVVQKTTDTPNDTSFYFSAATDALFEAMLVELRNHYKVDLKVENVVMPPGPLPSTSLLVDGRADIISQLNATGGETQGMRRRTSRRFTCTMSAISQYLHIPENSALASEINSIDDLYAREGLRICAGPLATQTARAFFPQHKVSTKFMNDLTGCVADTRAGKFDLIVNPLSSLEVADIKGFKAVNTWIVAGTPLWVAREDIACPSDGNPRTEDLCSTIEP
ncbi:MAG: hypothetical protein KDI87_01735 [Gammaproteobacteria bacterium]|nr:hypothetical protein [Gammaproteobacteria bacterium]